MGMVSIGTLSVLSMCVHPFSNSIQDKIAAECPDVEGAMFVSVNLGADKTTVSVATGNQEFHPVYMSLGNIHNDMRRAHRDGVAVLAFLPIPKGKS